MCAVYTPMKGPGGRELDLDRVPAYADFIKRHNITENVMPGGTNGESLSLTVDERKALAEAWAKAAPPLGLKVYMHIGSESLVDSVELARHAAATKGVSGIVAMTPVYFKPSVDTLVDYMATVASAAATVLSLAVFATILLLGDHLAAWHTGLSQATLSWLSLAAACSLVFSVNLGVQPMPLLMSTDPPV